MKMKSLRCPNCDANIDVEDGLDMFFCKYCGYHIVLEGQTDAAYYAKVQVKEMEHKERIQEKKHSQERYKIESKQKEERRSIAWCFGVLFLILIGVGIIVLFGNNSVKKDEEELQNIVEEIIEDIDNEDFSAAYVKANMLYWDNGYSSKGEEKWDSIREEIINEIEQAEEKATGKNSHQDDDGWFFGLF